MIDGPRPRRRIDTTVPHSARIWNYWTGGKDYYEVDRIAGDRYLDTYPPMRRFPPESRDWLRRAVTFLAQEEGARQFLDLGAGLPTSNNTHQIAQRIAPECRVVYVDHDPLVITHVDALLTSTPEGASSYVEADMEDTDLVLRGAGDTLDLSAPVAVVISDVLGHIVDWDEALGLVHRVMEALPSGSWLALSHSTAADEKHRRVQEEYNRSGAIPYIFREPSQTVELFAGLELVDPGYTSWPRWKPEATTGTATDRAGWGGVARKP